MVDRRVVALALPTLILVSWMLHSVIFNQKTVWIGTASEEELLRNYNNDGETREETDAHNTTVGTTLGEEKVPDSPAPTERLLDIGSPTCKEDFFKKMKPITEENKKRWQTMWQKHVKQHGKMVDSYSDQYVWRNMDVSQGNLTKGELIVISGMQNLSQTYKDSIRPVQAQLAYLNKEKVPHDSSQLVQHIRDHWIHPPTGLPLKLKHSKFTDHSQGQSGIIDDFLNLQMGGFFIECGALDGETRSNTLMLERFRGWTGLLVEADPINYQQVRLKQRNTYTIPACLGTTTYPSKMHFLANRNIGKLTEKKSSAFSKAYQVEAQCFPLSSILFALNRTCIDLFSLDVEGAEVPVLKTIPFDKIAIKALLVEFIHGQGRDSGLEKFMKSKGFKLVTPIFHQDLLFVNEKFYNT